MSSEPIISAHCYHELSTKRETPHEIQGCNQNVPDVGWGGVYHGWVEGYGMVGQGGLW